VQRETLRMAMDCCQRLALLVSKFRLPDLGPQIVLFSGK
jgi:hypothetical protein